MIPLDTYSYRNLLDNLYEAVYCVGPDRRIIFWNKAAENLIGYSESEALGKVACVQVEMRDKSDGDSSRLSACLVEQTLLDGKPREFDCYITRRDSRKIPVAARVNPIADGGGRVIGAVQILQDKSARVASRKVIEKLQIYALLDPLTGLANRRYIEKALDSRTDELRRYGLRFGLLFIDIDNFKHINDNHGHEFGDRVLCHVARGMSSIIRTSDILGRWGGEEFIAVILNVSRERLEQVAEKMRRHIELESARNERIGMPVTISIGGVLAAEAPTGGIDREAIIRRADELMYMSKKGGRNRVTIAGFGENAG